jgi:hypothetical protein
MSAGLSAAQPISFDVEDAALGFSAQPASDIGAVGIVGALAHQSNPFLKIVSFDTGQLMLVNTQRAHSG